MSSSELAIKPLSGALGAEVTGVQLAELVDRNSFGMIREALLEHLVLVVRDQHLTPEQHLSVGRALGTLNVHDFVEGLSDYPEIIEIVKEPEDNGYTFGGTWHTDVSYLERPSMASLLYAKEVPASGGDTLFANTYLAYETLSEGMKRMLESLRAVHSPKEIYSIVSKRGDRRAANQKSMSFQNPEQAFGEVIHPVIRTHPETSRKLLYVNGNFTLRFEDMSIEESRPLLEYLFAHLSRPEFSCRVRWHPDTLTIWDNRCTQHLAIGDYDGSRRRMHRVTVNGDRPH
tara:strand:+ start:387 stop:1247 length:861 start_codon:yes stop_codon:yes gene_type:complete